MECAEDKSTRSMMNKLVFTGATDVDCGAVAVSWFFFHVSRQRCLKVLIEESQRVG